MNFRFGEASTDRNMIRKQHDRKNDPLDQIFDQSFEVVIPENL